MKHKGNEKEDYIVTEMMRLNIKLLEISETKKKENGMKKQWTNVT